LAACRWNWRLQRQSYRGHHRIHRRTHDPYRKSSDFTRNLFRLNSKTLENCGKKNECSPFLSPADASERKMERSPRCNGGSTRQPATAVPSACSAPLLFRVILYEVRMSVLSLSHACIQNLPDALLFERIIYLLDCESFAVMLRI
jgi:hypothetical protein